MFKTIDAETFEFWLDSQIRESEESVKGRMHPRTRNKRQGILDGLKLVKINLDKFYTFGDNEDDKEN